MTDNVDMIFLPVHTTFTNRGKLLPNQRKYLVVVNIECTA